ncbi:BsuBI/PstI family type II restriction endonuclease [Saccharopolyspora phatthalungensis]|uniref:Type II restriction enzyme n=1 Tax=Saccharopolyspora phatthalungensis TaxID=664693 RepID=A0A840Q3L7_9PSEU|nr:BsuBI/PstI family type II restriction endonuclease [Saccharopolyspora phatthalungensis]MBB5153289.1 type II restriction enzyme [Saccharopolyspora phatthalungensis]
MKIDSKIREASEILAALGMDDQRSNERSARVLLALLRLRPEDNWDAADNPMLRTREIMNWVRDYYNHEYAPNTRETIRRFTLHQFAEALLVHQNPDKPDRPVNSPNWNYQAAGEALAVIRLYGTPQFDAAVAEYRAKVPGLKERYAAAREMNRIAVKLPNGNPFSLSPGGQNPLIKQMIEEFCPQFTPGAEILYVGDADAKWALFEADRLSGLGVTVDQHGKMPDLVVYMPDKDWLFLMEAVTSHGPVDAKRYGELASLFKDATPDLVYVSCFPDRKKMREYLPVIAWETEVWCAESPTHLIHFNGDKFLGPHK